MKHENHTETSRPALAVHKLLPPVLVAGLFMLSLQATAQVGFDPDDCTVGNWTSATGLTDADVDVQSASPTGQFRRYGGPCGLRVSVDGSARFLTDESPLAESTYIARFYAFFNNAGSGPILVFAADDGDDDVIQIWYEDGDLTLTVYDSADVSHDIDFQGIGNGWHSIELVWSASDGAENIRFALNTTDENDDETLSIDTSGISIVNAHLGNINSADTGGYINFDDFDSRRISRPGRLCRGDMNGDGIINLTDLLILQQEVASGGAVKVHGNPDYNEDGAINLTDMLFIQAFHVAVNNPDCPE